MEGNIEDKMMNGNIIAFEGVVRNEVNITPKPFWENAYMSYFSIEESEKHLKTLLETDAKRRIEVAISIDGMKKEFTLAEFKRLLGFEI